MSEVVFDGLEAIIKRLDGITDADKVKRAIGTACATVERTAKEKAPKGEGELRRSITSKVEEIGGEAIGTVYTPIFYAPYVEYGTGLFAEGGNGRKEVPWVYIEGGGGIKSNKKTVYATHQDAEESAAYLREVKGLDAVVTYGLKPTPYMRPALYENREKIKRILGEAIMQDD